MSFAGAKDVAFGPFRLSVRRRTLSRDGARVALTGRAFDVLAVLVDAPEAGVTKDELMRRVWGGLVVEENNLHVQIAAIRRALGAERYIVTLHGRGYRFIGDVRPAGQARAESLAATLASLSREEVLAVLDLSRSWDPPPGRRRAPALAARSRAEAAEGRDSAIVEFGDLVVSKAGRAPRP